MGGFDVLGAPVYRPLPGTAFSAAAAAPAPPPAAAIAQALANAAAASRPAPAPAPAIVQALTAAASPPPASSAVKAATTTATHVTPPPPATTKAPAAPSAQAVAAAQRGQAAAAHAISAGQALAKQNAGAGNRLISAGNAHAAKAKALLGPGPSSATPATSIPRRTVAMGDITSALTTYLDPTEFIAQSDILDAVASAGELANQMLSYVSTLQSSGLSGFSSAIRASGQASRRGM